MVDGHSLLTVLGEMLLAKCLESGRRLLRVEYGKDRKGQKSRPLCR